MEWAAESTERETTFWREAMIFTVLALVGFGILMALSIDGPREGVFPPLFDKAVRIVPGLLAFFVARAVPLERLRPLVVPGFGVVLLLCCLTHVLGPRVNGASRWIHLGAMSFQPVELLKPLCVFATAEMLERRRDELDDLVRGVLPVVALPGAAALVLLAQPDVGHAFFVLTVAGVLILVGGVRLRHSLGLMLGTGVALGIVLLFVFPHARMRVLSFFAEEPGYQIANSLAAFADGGLLGHGLGSGWFQLGYVPAARNDFVLAILGNELGLFGSLLVVALFVLLFVAAMNITKRASSYWLLLVGLGMAMNIVLQACLNILGVTHTIPEKGIDLPFLSSGGTNLVFALASVGILANIAHESAESLGASGRDALLRAKQSGSGPGAGAQ